MSVKPFKNIAARKRQSIFFRGATFILTVTDDWEHPGHIHVLLTTDKPPRGLDKELYSVHMKPPESERR